MSEPQVVLLPDIVYRVARADDPLRPSVIRPDDAVLPRAGNRYDVAGGGVLYASTQVEACFGETTSRFRVSPVLREVLGDDEHFMNAGSIPRDWRLRRTIVTIAASTPAPFLDVDHPETQQVLTRALAPVLATLGYSEPLDLSHVRNSDRRLSRAVALWAYSETDDEGHYLYSGIRYASRIHDRWENWAIFDGTEIFETSRRPIQVADPDLLRVARMWDLSVH